MTRGPQKTKTNNKKNKKKTKGKNKNKNKNRNKNKQTNKQTKAWLEINNYMYSQPALGAYRLERLRYCP
mgnify:CR=1 FL=1